MAGLGIQNRGCGIARIQKAEGGRATTSQVNKEGNFNQVG